MAMVPDRIAIKKYSDNYLKIQASVMTSLSTSDHTYVWNMGDGSTEVTGVTFLEHTYHEDGVYQIALKITGPEVPGDTHTLEIFQQVVISSHTKTQLSGSIYDLVYNYIPKALNSHIGNNQIDFFIVTHTYHPFLILAYSPLGEKSIAVWPRDFLARRDFKGPGIYFRNVRQAICGPERPRPHVNKLFFRGRDRIFGFFA